MGRRLPALAGLALAVLLAACGSERQRAETVPRPAGPVGSQVQSFPDQGISFRKPRNWYVAGGRGSNLASVYSGRATVVLWRYPRRERLPATDEDLSRASRALVAAARARDRTIQVASVRALRVGGSPAVQVLATARIGIERRRVRSTHIYAHGAELVIDAYAPLPDFARVDRSVFQPLVASVRLRRA